MVKSLVIIGSSSKVLDRFAPSAIYERIIIADREKPESTLYDYDEFVHYDLADNKSTERVLKSIVGSREISILFSSFGRVKMGIDSDIDEIMLSLKMNCAQPINLFGKMMLEYPTQSITGVFISSMYALVAPKPANYEGITPINPLFYGVAKAGVQQGIKWLSCQNKKHRFNAIALGPIPSDNVIEEDPKLIRNLKQSVPTEELVNTDELSNIINWLLDPSLNSLRGATIPLDGGYTLW